MSGVVLLGAPGGVQVELAGVERLGLRQTWTGPNGVTFLLSDSGDVRERSGVRLKQGVRGLGKPTFERRPSTSPVLAGSRASHLRALERPVVWPLGVYFDGASQDWYDFDAAFWSTMDARADGQWTVTTPDGSSRTLDCRYVAGGDEAWDRDPGLMGWATYLVNLVAEQPYWRGQVIRREFADDPAKPFFGDAGTGGPPFNISASATLTGATMLNPGDVPAFPVWTVHGPFTRVVVGVGGRTIVVPFTIPAGKSLTIDPRPRGPRGLSAYDSDGVRRTQDLESSDFAAIPRGESVPLTLAMTGTGRIVVELEPLYERAY